MEQKIITVEEASILLSTTPKTIRQRLYENKKYLTSTKIKRRIHIIVDDIFNDRMERIESLKKNPIKWGNANAV